MPEQIYLGFARHDQSQVTLEDTVILPDASGSMALGDYRPTRIDGAKDAAKGLTQVKFAQYPLDRIGVVSYADEAEIHLPLTTVGSHAGDINKAIDDIELRGTTNMSAGLQAAEVVLNGQDNQSLMDVAKAHVAAVLKPNASARAAHSGRQRRIILLTDGGHNVGSQQELFEIADRLKQSGVVIATIGIGGDPSDVNEADLKRIASIHPRTGQPMYCFIADSQSLQIEFKRQAHHLVRMPTTDT